MITPQNKLTSLIVLLAFLFMLPCKANENPNTDTEELPDYEISNNNLFYSFKFANTKGVFVGSIQMNPKPQDWEVVIDSKKRENSKKIDNYIFVKFNKTIHESFYLVKQNSQNIQNGQISPNDYVCYVSDETPIVIILGTIVTSSAIFKKKKLTLVDFHKTLQEKKYVKFDRINKIKMYKYVNEMEIFSNISKLQKTKNYIHLQNDYHKSFFVNKIEEGRMLNYYTNNYKNCFLNTVTQLFDFLIESDKKNENGENIEKFNNIKKEVFNYINIAISLIKTDIKHYFKDFILRGNKFLGILKEEIFHNPENTVFLNPNLFPYPKSLFSEKFVKNEKFIQVYLDFFLKNFLSSKNMKKENDFQKLINFDKIVSRIESNIQIYARKEELAIPKQFSLKSIFKQKKDQFLKINSFLNHEIIVNKLKAFLNSYIQYLHDDESVGDLDLFPSSSTVYIDQLNDIYGLVNPMYINNNNSAAANIDIIIKKKSFLEYE